MNYGGLVAGPIFSRIAEKAARYLDLEPHEELGKAPVGGTGGLNQCLAPLSALRPPCHHLMQLKILAAAISARQIIGPLDRVVESIAYDSRRVQRNCLFVALRGEKSDGHQFIEQAIEKGASVIVTEQEVQQPRATCLVVENTRARAG